MKSLEGYQPAYPYTDTDNEGFEPSADTFLAYSLNDLREGESFYLVVRITKMERMPHLHKYISYSPDGGSRWVVQKYRMVSEHNFKIEVPRKINREIKLFRGMFDGGL